VSKRWVLITIRLGFVIIYLNQSSERNMIDIPGCSERTNFKYETGFKLTLFVLESSTQGSSESYVLGVVHNFSLHLCRQSGSGRVLGAGYDNDLNFL
jgi:hypothetical protein